MKFRSRGEMYRGRTRPARRIKHSGTRVVGGREEAEEDESRPRAHVFDKRLQPTMMSLRDLEYLNPGRRPRWNPASEELDHITRPRNVRSPLFISAGDFSPRFTFCRAVIHRRRAVATGRIVQLIWQDFSYHICTSYTVAQW